MLCDLPQNVLWNIFEKLGDVKACVNTWTCCSSIFHLYTPNDFWQQMNRVFYGVDTLGEKVCHPEPLWINTFWKHYAETNGCAFCCKYSSKTKGSFVNVDTLKVYVCKHCQTNIGKQFVHKRLIDTWEAQMARRKSGYHPNCLFKNYFGENILSWCHRYNLKCVGCLKNIRNERCGSFCCGKCCQCKYHKSHYESYCNPQAIFLLSLDMTSFSSDIKDIKQLLSKCSSSSTKKKQIALRNLIIV